MDPGLLSKESRHTVQLRLLLQTIESRCCLDNRPRKVAQYLDEYDPGDLDCTVNPSELFYNYLVAASKRVGGRLGPCILCGPAGIVCMFLWLWAVQSAKVLPGL